MSFRLGRAASGLLLGLALLALCLPLLLALTAQPMQETRTINRAQLNLSLDRGRVWLPTDCVTVSWQVDGIREVYFNGEGVTGAGERVVCPADTPSVLRVVLQDGTEQTLTLQAQVTSLSLLALGCYALASGLLIVVARWGSLAWWSRFAFGVQRQVERLPERLTMVGAWLTAHPVLVVTAITLLGAALRVPLVAHRPLIQDEAMLEIIARGSLVQVLDQNARWNSAPPLFALITHLVLWVGNSELLLRALPLFASILAIPAFYVLARQFVRRGAAYLAALTLATALMPVYYAHYTREYSLTLLLAIVIVLAFLRARQTPTARRLTVLGVVWSVALFTQYGLALLILPLNAWLLLSVGGRLRHLDPERRRRLLVWLVSLQAIFALVVLTVFLVSLGSHLRGGSFAGDGYLRFTYWDQQSASLWPFVWGGGLSHAAFAYGAGIFGQTWTLEGGLLLSALGLIAVLAARSRTPLALLRRLLLAVFAVALIFGLTRLYPYTGGRQTIYASLFVFLLAAAAYEVLLVGTPVRVMRTVAFLLAALVVVSGLHNVSRYTAHLGYDDVRPLAGEVAVEWQDGDRLLLVGSAGILFDRYFLQQFPERRAATTTVSSDPASYGEALARLSASPGRVWIVVPDEQARFEDFVASQPYGSRIGRRSAWTNVDLYTLNP